MRLSRRSFGAGVLGAGLAGLAGVRPAAAAGGADLARRLAEELNGRLLANPAAALFSVAEVGAAPGPAGGVAMTARLRLDWAPGMRLRCLRGAGATEAAAWEALRDAAVAEFAGVVPGFAADRTAA